jgi:hypothetical protein
VRIGPPLRVELTCYFAFVRGSSIAMFALPLAVASCSGVSAPPKPPLEVVVRVESDPNQPLAGAEVVFNGKVIATTDDEGGAKLSLQGNEGDAYEVNVRCPDGFQSPTKSLVIPLHRLVDNSMPPEYDVQCPPTKRTAVVAIRAENGANVPVVYLGRVLARLDASGAATVMLENLDADQSFDLTLDTSEKGNEQLRPQSPSNSFSLKSGDDVLSWDAKFTVEAVKKIHKYVKKATGPTVIHVGGNK